MLACAAACWRPLPSGPCAPPHSRPNARREDPWAATGAASSGKERSAARVHDLRETAPLDICTDAPIRTHARADKAAPAPAQPNSPICDSADVPIGPGKRPRFPLLCTSPLRVPTGFRAPVMALIYSAAQCSKGGTYSGLLARLRRARSQPRDHGKAARPAGPVVRPPGCISQQVTPVGEKPLGLAAPAQVDRSGRKAAQ